MINFALLQAWFMGLLPFMLVLALVVVMDLISGILRSWKGGDFDWEFLPNFLKTGVVYLWAWLSAEILAFIPLLLRIEIPGWGEALANYAPKAVFAFIVLTKYVASIIGNIKWAKELNSEGDKPEWKLVPVSDGPVYTTSDGSTCIVYTDGTAAVAGTPVDEPDPQPQG